MSDKAPDARGGRRPVLNLTRALRDDTSVKMLNVRTSRHLVLNSTKIFGEEKIMSDRTGCQMKLTLSTELDEGLSDGSVGQDTRMSEQTDT